MQPSAQICVTLTPTSDAKLHWSTVTLALKNVQIFVVLHFAVFDAL